MLTANQISRITKELVLGVPPTLTTDEALALRTKIAEDLVKMRKAGIMPDISYDVEFTEDAPPATVAPLADYSDPIHLTGRITLNKIQAVLSPA